MASGLFLNLRDAFPSATSIFGIFDVEFEHFTNTLQALLETESVEELNAHFQKGLPFYKQHLMENKVLDTLYTNFIEKSPRTDGDVRKALQLTTLMKLMEPNSYWPKIAETICRLNLQEIDKTNALIDEMIAHDAAEEHPPEFQSELLKRQRTYETPDTINLLSNMGEILKLYGEKAKKTTIPPNNSITFFNKV